MEFEGCWTDISYADGIIKFKFITGLIKDDILTTQNERSLSKLVNSSETAGAVSPDPMERPWEVEIPVIHMTLNNLGTTLGRSLTYYQQNCLFNTGRREPGTQISNLNLHANRKDFYHLHEVEWPIPG